MIAQRVARYLERQGFLVRDAENGYLTCDGVDADPDSRMTQLLGNSITYRIAVGPQQGRKVFALQTLPDCRPDSPFAHTVDKVAGFSLHAGVATRANERAKLERLYRYITRPAVSTQRLSLTGHGKVRYELKTPYSDGTSHVLLELLDFIVHLTALVPKPCVNLTRFYGVFAPNSKYRMQVPDIHQRRLRVVSRYSPHPDMQFCFCPESSYSPSANFSVASSSFRPKAALRVLHR